MTRACKKPAKNSESSLWATSDHWPKVSTEHKTYEDIDGVIKLRKAIDALDQAIAKGWAREPSSESRPLESKTWVEAANEDEPPGG